MPIKAYYNASLSSFLNSDAERILGVLTLEHHHALEQQQRWAWLQQLSILKQALAGRPGGRIFLEFYIPRMGKRADAVLISENIVFVIEFKVGASEHLSSALNQVEDYALDLKIFMKAVILFRSFRYWFRAMLNLSRCPSSNLPMTSSPHPS